MNAYFDGLGKGTTVAPKVILLECDIVNATGKYLQITDLFFTQVYLIANAVRKWSLLLLLVRESLLPHSCECLILVLNLVPGLGQVFTSAHCLSNE